MVIPIAWLVFVLLFFFFPSHLSTSQICQTLDRVKQKWVLSAVPWKPRELVAHPALPFPVMRTLFSWKVPSWCWVVLACGMEWCRQNEMFFSLIFVWWFAGFLFHCVAKFLKWTLEQSESCFYLWIAVFLLILVGGQRLGSPTSPSWWHHFRKELSYFKIREL